MAGMVFEHETLEQRVLFGAGKAAQFLAQEVDRLGSARIMVIAGPRDKARAAAMVNGLDVALFYNDVAQHVPAANAVRARLAAADQGIDLLVSFGGGSATGLAKAVALTTGLPVVAIPTTYAGSEATNVWGMTENGQKRTGTDRRVLPATVIYDAALTLSLPPSLSVASGLNALAHCIDSLWAPAADPINAALAVEGMRALAMGLPTVKSDPGFLRGREDMLYGAYLAAVAFASAGSGLHHKICHVLGGRYNLPHAQTHAVVLPYVLAFNSGAVPDTVARIASALGTTYAVAGLNALYLELEAPQALKDIGLEGSDLTEAVDLLLPQVPRSNPVPVTRQGLTNLLRAAWSGVPVS